ncbi:MAG: response regulator [Deltaproteobacteria bacterium]|nr:response regulator [Deltaproteobacteria bacterium]
MAEIFDYKMFPILFVDDERDATETFRQQFQDEFLLILTNSPEEGLEIVRREKPAVVIADQKMPTLTGAQFLEIVRKEHPETFRILLTAYSDIAAIIEAVNKGEIYRYFAKPYNVAEMEITLKRSLETYKIARERDRLYREKIEIFQKLSRTNRLAGLGHLAEGMAHEIRNPLVAIKTFFDLLPEKKEDYEFMTRFAEIARKEVHRIAKLLDELTRFAEPPKPCLMEVDLNEIARSVIGLVETEAKSHKVDIRSNLGEDFSLVVLDPEQIKQVLLNIVLNGLQAMSPGGLLEIETRRGIRPNEIQIIISDSGAGIPSENMEAIFNPFFTTKAPNQGVGLGLSIAHQIIQEHKGSIDVESRIHEGTKFIVTLPKNPLQASGLGEHGV